MADGRKDLMMLIEKLNNTVNFRNSSATRSCIYEILTLSNNGCDVTVALPIVAKLLAHNDTFVKRVAGELIAIYSYENPDITLLAVNTLVQDCKDVNPYVRGHGLRILGSLHSESTAELLHQVIIQGLEDSSPHVRTCAALASIHLNKISPSTVSDGGLWDLLYSHLNDADSATVASCLCALEEIFTQSTGVVISHKLGQYLIKNCSAFTPTVRIFILQFLLKYSPKSKSAMFEHLNDLDESLTQSTSIATTLCSLELFCYLTANLPKVKLKVCATAWSSIRVLLARERDEEMLTAVIDYLCNTDFPVEVLVPDSNTFFCRDDDSVYLMMQKLRMLSRLITAANAESILEEVLRSVKFASTEVLREMVQNIFCVVREKPDIEEACVQFLTKLTQLTNSSAQECIIQLLPEVTFLREESWSVLSGCVRNSFQKIESLNGKMALLEILRKRPGLVEDAFDIVEQMMLVLDEWHLHKEPQFKSDSLTIPVFNVKSPNGLEKLKLSLLNCLVELCLKHPARVQPVLAKLMEECIRDENRNVRDRALFLYGYLRGQVRHRQTLVSKT